MPPTSQISQCREILQEIFDQRHLGYSWPFFKPLDASLFFLGLSDYGTVIKHPMDLTTVKKNLDNGVYSTAEMFAADVRRIFKNCYVYCLVGQKTLVYTDPDDQDKPTVLRNMAKRLEGVRIKIHSGPENLKKTRPKKNLRSQRNQLHEKFFCHFKNGQKSIFEVGKSLKLPKMLYEEKN